MGTRMPDWAPGAREAKAVASRWALFIWSGRLAYVVFSITRPTVALVVSRTGGAALTSTVSVVSPRDNTGLKPRTPRALTARLSCLRLRKPGAVTLTE